MTLADTLRALASGGPAGGRYRGTDPPARLASGPGSGPAEAQPATYAARSRARAAVLQQLDEVCFWHLLLIEIPADCREITAARRELHLRLRNSQLVDDLEYAKQINGG